MNIKFRTKQWNIYFKQLKNDISTETGAFTSAVFLQIGNLVSHLILINFNSFAGIRVIQNFSIKFIGSPMVVLDVEVEFKDT